MIIIKDNNSMIDETKIISVVSTGCQSIKIIFDNGHNFHALEFFYDSKKDKDRYLEKLRKKLCPEDK